MSTRLTLVSAAVVAAATLSYSASAVLPDASGASGSGGSSDDMPTLFPSGFPSGSLPSGVPSGFSSDATTAPSGTTAPATTEGRTEPPTTTTAPFVTGTVTAPADQFPATVVFETNQPESFWPSFKLYLQSQEAAARAMAAAAAAGDIYNGHIFLGCVPKSTAYGCSVGFSSAAAATTALTAANNDELASYGITGAELGTRPPSAAPARSLLAAGAALGLSVVTMLLA